MLRISKILVNHNQTVGVKSINSICWKIESDKDDVMQTAYRIVVLNRTNNEQIIYDSGKKKSARSINAVDLSTLQLEEAKKYFLKVKVYDEEEESDWAETSFITAWKEKWDALFITAEDKEDIEKSIGTYVRKKVHLEKEISEAYIYCTGLGIYDLYINGKHVGEDVLSPGWTSYRNNLRYQTYEVTDYLEEGANILGAHIGAGWYKGSMGPAKIKNHYGNFTAFSCNLIIYTKDGKREVIKTDETWKGAKSPVVFSEIYDGEIYDARKEILKWNEKKCEYKKWFSVKKVENIPVKIQPQICKGVRRQEIVEAKRVLITPKGEIVIDFGQNMTGWIMFEATGKKGEKVEIDCFETLDKEGNVYLKNLRSAKQKIKYYFRDEKKVFFYPHFTYQGFRYIHVKSYPGEIKKEYFKGIVLQTELERTGWFECSDERVNQLFQNILWSMKGNFLSIPSDCPQRDERLGWAGDAQIFSATACYLMDVYSFYENWLNNLVVDQTSDGNLPDFTPMIKVLEEKDASEFYGSSGWGDAIAIIPWTLYQFYGDKNILRRFSNNIEKWIGYMGNYCENYIYRPGEQYGDWLGLDSEEGSYKGATPDEYICTAFMANTILIYCNILEALQRPENELKRYRKLYDNIVQAFQNEYFDQKGEIKIKTQTACVLALEFNLVLGEYKNNVINQLCLLLQENNNHLTTGFLGTPYLCNVLSNNSQSQLAYELLFDEDYPSWLYQVKKGATTIWEHWDGVKEDGSFWSEDMNSFNHYSYGAIGAWIYRYLSGIKINMIEAPEIVIHPQISEKLQYAFSKYDSIYGTIECGWLKKNGEITICIRIPCNTNAVIELENVRELLDSAELNFEQGARGIKTRVGSGEYKIKYLERL